MKESEGISQRSFMHNSMTEGRRDLGGVRQSGKTWGQL